MVAAVPTRGVVLGNVANYLALRIEKSRRSVKEQRDCMLNEKSAANDKLD
jgi:hypothetical protein